MTILPELDWTVTVGQTITFLTMIAGFVYTWFREARARRWAQEDAEKKNQHLKKQDAAIEQSKQAMQDAFQEANSINKKIATYEEEILILQAQLKNIAQRKGDPRIDRLTRCTDKEKPE